MYSFGWMLRKRDPDTGGIQDYPVDPQEIATALAAEMEFTTGFIPDDILYHKQVGTKQTVVGYRKQQKTGLWLDGREDAIRVPLPHMVMIRTTTGGSNPDYEVYACHKRPETLTDDLYYAPLPNVFNHGGICWGTVSRGTTFKGMSLAEDWKNLLGSRFGNHAVGGKSKKHRSDIRDMLLELDKNQRRRVYPRSDLIPANTNLAKILKINTEASS
ncbi:MAG: hypothetical protein AAFU54_19060 [Chloroflexota bacterium]